MTEHEASILVIEDEFHMRRFIRASLASHGYRVLEAESADEGMRLLTSQNPELLLLDLGLPDGDGLELLQEIREWSRIPILIISARGKEEEKVTALDTGADDYLTKPFGVNELLARIRVALRHSAYSLGERSASPLEFGELHVDLIHRQVRFAGKELHLTPIEYKLLVLLAQNAGKVLTHRQILKEVWGLAYISQTHYVRVHVAELRKKIERDPARPQLLVSEPGIGYRLRESPAEWGKTPS